MGYQLLSSSYSLLEQLQHPPQYLFLLLTTSSSSSHGAGHRTYPSIRLRRTASITLRSEYPSIIVTLLNKLRSQVHIVREAFSSPPIIFTAPGDILDEWNSFFS